MRPGYLDRRHFLKSTSTAALAASFYSAAIGRVSAEDAEPRFKKAVKFAMIGDGESVEEKFALIKELGFQGVEMDSPSRIDREEVIAAKNNTGIDIHGVVDSIHWDLRLSDPDDEVRSEALAGLGTAMRDCKAYGGTTVLLVPGKVTDEQEENFDQVWERSSKEIKKAIPSAKKLKVKIAVETVWNNFITTPDQLVKYIDQFNTPTVGAYFDCSNMLKFGVPSEDWIRALDKRLLKFDFKGYSKDKKWVAIGEGDENWPEILRALDEIGYHGWATAEVEGGNRKALQEVSRRMDKVLGLA
jgi:L-ribulose-5-phosphate 3-epimerase